MEAAGRVIRALGWLVIIGGGLARFFGFDQINLFTGVVFIVVGGMLRSRARSQAPDPDDELATSEERVLNTQRPSPAPVRSEPVVRPYQPPPVAEPAPEPADEDREEILEQILLAGTEYATETSSRSSSGDMEPASHLTSAEMIAHARRRWDRKG
jgi:hypothetical protein